MIRLRHPPLLARGLALAWVLVLSLAAAPRERPDFGLVFNDDADLSFVVPDRARSEALLRANLQALADTPVKTLVYCIGMGGDVLYYNTEVASRVGWRVSADEKPGSLMAKRMENARVCLAQGADAVRTAGETARALGLRFIPSLRMNDAHFMVKPDDHAMTSEFWLKHRDTFTIKTSPLAFQPAYGNLLDYTHPEVRQLRLATVQEVLARNRDLVDGFELDFNRFQLFFPKGGAAAWRAADDRPGAGGARLARSARPRGRSSAALVRARAPFTRRLCATAGLAVEDWIREGLVDLVSPAQLMTLAGRHADLGLDRARPGARRARAPVPLSPHELAPAVSTRQCAERYAGVKPSREATLAEVRAAAAAYRHLGADGFYLFNFYNAFGSTRPHDPRLYQVFRDLARSENALGQPLVYALTKRYYHDGPGSYAYGKALPARLDADQALALSLSLGALPGSGPFPLTGSEARLGFRALPMDADVEVRLNGTLLHQGPVSARRASAATAPALTGVRRPADFADVYLHLPLSVPGPLHAGRNDWSIRVSKTAPAPRSRTSRCVSTFRTIWTCCGSGGRLPSPAWLRPRPGPANLFPRRRPRPRLTRVRVQRAPKQCLLLVSGAVAASHRDHRRSRRWRPSDPGPDRPGVPGRVCQSLARHATRRRLARAPGWRTACVYDGCTCRESTLLSGW
jgi:hypothetical protein